MKEIKLTKGYFTQVDDEDFEWLSQWKWVATIDRRNIYAKSLIKDERGKVILLPMHRLILQINDSNILVDHKNGDGLCNLRENLRVCTRQQNAMNKKSDLGSSSPFKGVSWRNREKKWYSAIYANKKHTHIGSFKDEMEAARAYDAKARELFGEFARFNFP